MIERVITSKNIKRIHKYNSYPFLRPIFESIKINTRLGLLTYWLNSNYSHQMLSSQLFIICNFLCLELFLAILSNLKHSNEAIQINDKNACKYWKQKIVMDKFLSQNMKNLSRKGSILGIGPLHRRKLSWIVIGKMPNQINNMMAIHSWGK